MVAELGERYCQLLLQERKVDNARRELNGLLELLPGHPPFVRLQEEAVRQSGRAEPSPVSAKPVAQGRPASALAELRSRIVASRALNLDAVTVSAHNLDRIYLVDRGAADHEVKIDVAVEAPGGSGANTVAASRGSGAQLLPR